MAEPNETPPGDRKSLKADAAAAKARSKASRPFYKKKRFIIPVVLLLLIILIVATSGGEDNPSGADDPAADTETTSEGNEEPDTTGIGSPARDGSFEFTVNSLECGETTVGDEFLEEEAQGQFCFLDVRVENIGDSAGTLFADNQLLLNDEGTQYSADSMATLTNAPDSDTLFSQINPGNAVEGAIVFDVPADAVITQAELHDSAFSGGVLVDIR